MIKAVRVWVSLPTEALNGGHEVDLALEELLIRKLVCARVLPS